MKNARFVMGMLRMENESLCVTAIQTVCSRQLILLTCISEKVLMFINFVVVD